MMVFNDKWNHIPAFCDLTSRQARAIPTVLECAGLLHDMGNPPFGHEGEYSLGEWFQRNLARDDFDFFGKPVREVLGPVLCTDLCKFEGNAQVIRMLSRSRFVSEEQEANVTFATVSTLIKYPVSSAEADRSAADLRMHKFGYYRSEEALAKTIRSHTGLNLPDQPYARHPLTYLLEAADDIAYVCSDVEDAVSKKAISVHQLVWFLENKLNALPTDGDETHQMQLLTFEGMLNNLKKRISVCGGREDAEAGMLHKWTNYLKNWLMYVAASSFVANWEPIMNGEYQNDLLESSLHKYTVASLKAEMEENVYPTLAEDHLAARHVIRSLLDLFCPAVLYWDTSVPVPLMHSKCITLLPRVLKEAYQQQKTSDPAFNLYLRFRTVTDFLANMTDRRIHDLYKAVNAL